MSFLAGFVQQMNTIAERNERFRMEQRDRAERREMEMRGIIENRRNAVIPLVLERMAEMQNFEKGEKAKQAFLVKQGLSPSTVAALTISGQDDQVIATIQKAITDNKYDREFASDLDAFVTAKIKDSGIDPAKLGSMLSEGLYGVDAKTEEGRAMGVTQALMSLMDTDEPFKAAEDMMASIISREQLRSDAPSVSLPGINLGAAVQLSLENQKKIKNALETAVASQIAKDSFVPNAFGERVYTGGNKNVDDLVSKMYAEVLSRGGEVGSPVSLSTAITESTDRFRNIYDSVKDPREVRRLYGLPVDTTDSATNNVVTPATGSATGASAVETGVDGAPVVPILPRPVDPYAENFQGQGGK